MANEIVPERSWGRSSFGLADVRTADVQIKYATQQLGYPVWGMSPSSTPDDTGGYAGYGVEGLVFPYFGLGATASNPNLGLSQCHGCATEDVVTPHASFLALDVTPQQAYANILALRTRYPGVYGADGFFDAVNPTTGSVGHRYLVLDQSGPNSGLRLGQRLPVTKNDARQAINDVRALVEEIAKAYRRPTHI